MSQHDVIVGIGEILWDVFSDGCRFGGAPANFACNAAGLGSNHATIFMVGSVGRDDLGRRAIESLHDHGVDTSHVTSVDRPTGCVIVALNEDGQASFQITAQSAWDDLAWSNELGKLAGRAAAVCFGTLGQRSEVARKTIRQFVSSTPPRCLRICDINLRPPFCSDATIRESLALANVLKLNDEELLAVASVCNLSGASREIVRQLVRRYRLKVVALTCGASGSILYRGDEVSEQPAIATNVVDTVGAGDAFTAALTLGLLSDRDLDTIHRTAGMVAAFVCTQRGAAPKMPAQFVSLSNTVC